MPQPPIQTAARSSLRALRRFGQPAEPAERCDLCRQPLGPEHQHLVDPADRRLMCACDACALLFSYDGETKFRRVPRDAYRLTDLSLDQAGWDALDIPIGLAFFFRSSPAGAAAAIYPSPAGPTESPVDDAVWQRIEHDNPVLARMRADTQALLINRLNGSREHYIVPIDRCYRLVGLIRSNWEGFTGGEKMRRAVAEFFTTLRRRSRPTGNEGGSP